MEKNIYLKVSQEDNGKRLDVFLSEKNLLPSRSQIQKNIREKRVLVNNAPQRSSYRVNENDRIHLDVIEPVPPQTHPEKIPIDIIFEDDSIIIVNKPAGMVVHPSCGNYSGTLINALLYHCKSLSGIGGIMRPGIVHRLDKGTSGVLVVAKNDSAHFALSKQFTAHTIKRKYLALVYGAAEKKSGRVETLIGRHPIDRKKMSARPRSGKKAITYWEAKEWFHENVSLVEATLETGRTHQVRVHLSSIGHPVVGDNVYGSAKRIRELKCQSIKEAFLKIKRPLLHAYYLGFMHPETQKYREFKVPLPEDFSGVLSVLRKKT